MSMPIQTPICADGFKHSLEYHQTLEGKAYWVCTKGGCSYAEFEYEDSSG